MSGIEWTEKTWNPVAGCTKISTGCKNCYAERISNRLKILGTRGYEKGFKLNLVESRLDIPLKRKKPTIYFVNSMSDLFHENIPIEYIDKVFSIIRKTPQHKYQILTKRADGMAKYFHRKLVPLNVMLGVSVENIKDGVPRIKHLQKIECRYRFLSIEPLLEDLGLFNIDKICWVIVGGESGGKARPMKPHWVHNIRVCCYINDVPFFFKQWGAYGGDGIKRRKDLNGASLDGKAYREIPSFLCDVE